MTTQLTPAQIAHMRAWVKAFRSGDYEGLSLTETERVLMLPEIRLKTKLPQIADAIERTWPEVRP